jgi:hypothetical protein
VVDSPTPRRILVVSGEPDVREGWARYFEVCGLHVIRCAGPEATHCALEQGAHCPLLDEADAAYYDNACVTEELVVDLLNRPRLLPIFIANDQPTSGGGHVPEVSHAI